MRWLPWLIAAACAVGWLLTLHPEWVPWRGLAQGLAPTPRERLVRQFAASGLDTSALGRAWLAAGARVFAEAERAEAPFSTRLYFAEAPRAYGFVLAPARGRVLTLIVTDSLAGGEALVELYVLGADGPELLEARPRGRDSLRYFVDEPERRLLLRVEATPLAVGWVGLRVGTEPQLSVFPVGGAGLRDVGSLWGDPRDGGRRRHEGIDVFHPRGTPLLAAADGRVTRVRDGGLGGRQVWLRTADGLRLYYAHLDRQLATEGQTLRAGDTLGTVGNTGNARTTPPHLHFGVYAERGAVDPLPFVRPAARAGVLPDPPRTLPVGRWLRTRQQVRPFAGDEGSAAASGVRLPAKQAVRVRRLLGRRALVELPDGTEHWLRLRDLEALAPQRQRTAGRDLTLRVPAPLAPGRVAVMGALAEGDTYAELATDARLGCLVRAAGGIEGWLAAGG